MQKTKTITDSTLYKRCAVQYVDKTITRTKKYLQDPNEKNVHDVRTSIRRLDAVLSLLPKKAKSKGSVKNFHKACRQLFKINSRIRDADIISEKINNYSHQFPILADGEILQSLAKDKERRIAKSKKLAEKIISMKTPKISNVKLSYYKLKSRFDREALDLLDQVENNMEMVTRDENNAEVLHELRKNGKRLRYLLELSIEREYSSILSNLKNMQDLLGRIHDYDIMIDYLEDCREKYEDGADGNKEALDYVYKQELEQRRQDFQKLTMAFAFPK